MEEVPVAHGNRHIDKHKENISCLHSMQCQNSHVIVSLATKSEIPGPEVSLEDLLAAGKGGRTWPSQGY